MISPLWLKTVPLKSTSQGSFLKRDLRGVTHYVSALTLPVQLRCRAISQATDKQFASKGGKLSRCRIGGMPDDKLVFTAHRPNAGRMTKGATALPFQRRCKKLLHL